MFNSIWIPLCNDYKDITGSEVIYGGAVGGVKRNRNEETKCINEWDKYDTEIEFFFDE